MSFLPIQEKVRNSVLSQDVTLYEVQVDRDELYLAYLDALPQEERQAHTCTCCKLFFRKYGHLVAIDENNEYVSIWDFGVDGIYKDVPSTLLSIVLTRPITNVFYTDCAEAGLDHNLQLVGGKVIRWDHFVGKIRQNIVSKFKLGEKIGLSNTSKNVITRSLNELSLEAIDTVLDLITNNTLYRGQQNKDTLTKFREHHVKYSESGSDPLYVWRNIFHIPPIRNSSIGTLLVDLTGGEDVVVAVGKYEAMVAPSNYSRPKKIITQAMIEAAKETLGDLGYLDSIKRRHATAEDISINDVHYVYRASSTAGQDADPFAALSSNVAPTIKKNNAYVYG